ncbi:TetR/AcrR family transcriptional regulator [Planotetraspora kaengkrachanensis]|uniref:TetR family transcriptional regulator n=1 Tax=Planotetraspora kaengkrachanensis TaxID=575193 RepID=A0A8J3LVT0_9ACTN|nr:TetR/AcrR family transcriptional regulator [Planotetraspora kaengkrachanensis]GIG77428.1 TetR family transcriptional regulator [Planotetraspora kaengkrachanensis]
MSGAEEGLRERKKRETRQRIADIAMGLFLQRGFDNVTVAEVARAADVSVNTVFNYFTTKEDLFLDRSDEVESLPRKVIEERRPGETAVQALRRDFFDALDTGDWRYGMHEGSDMFARRVRESPSLSARLVLLDYNREEQFAKALADATDADPDDLTPWLVASQMNATLRTLSRRFTMRQMAGEDTGRVLEDIRLDARQAFELLENGVGDYALRRAGDAGAQSEEIAPDRVQT